MTEHYTLTTEPDSEPNQCDGCRRDLPIVNGMHVDHNGMPVMVCTSGRYESNPAPTPDGGEGALEALTERAAITYESYCGEPVDRSALHIAICEIRRALREPRVPEAINVIFDGPPGPTAGRFVEVETDDGRSVRVGEWIERDDGLWALRIDRALAQSEQGQSDASHTANIIALDHAADILDPDTPEAIRGAHSDHWKRVAARNLRDISDQIRRNGAAAGGQRR